MKLIAILSACVALPIGLGIGYSLKPDPAPAPFGEYVLDTLSVKHVPGQDTDDWIAVAVTGPNKGGALDVVQALSVYPTHADLEQSAQGKVEYYELTCSDYATGGAKNPYAVPNFVRKCSSEKKTRKQVENFMTELLAPVPKA